MDGENAALIRLLSIPPRNRTQADIAQLHAQFRAIEDLVGGIVAGPTSAHRDAQLRVICQLAQHRRVPGDVLLYQAGDLCDAWFVLLTGSVLIETSMFLPRACFGISANDAAFRTSDCLVLEPSDLIVIPYPDRDRAQARFTDTHRQAVTSYKRRLSYDASNDNQSSSGMGTNSPSIASRHLPGRISSPTGTTTLTSPSMDPSPIADRTYYPHPSRHLGSDTSSAHSSGAAGDAYSDSGRASSYMSSSERGGPVREKSVGAPVRSSQGTSDQSLVDSADEDEDFESSSHESLRDAFWESVLKEPHERTEEDIQTLMENVQQLPAFSNLTKATRRALCGVMVVAMVHEAGQVVLGDNEPLDTWSVVLSGTVEVIEPDGTVRELTRGDSFGVRPGRAERTHRGVMRTVTEDCQFVCVLQSDYLRIMSREGEAEIPEMGEGGRVVLVYEAVEDETAAAAAAAAVAKSPGSDTPRSKATRMVTKGTPEKLIEHLVADLSNVDITYPEDFLLTYRTFLDSPQSIVVRLLSWHMHNPQLRSRVNRIVLLWVHNHFNDFEGSPEMMKFVENFDRILASDGTAGERRLFQLACSTKARPRHIDLDLPVHQTVKPHPALQPLLSPNDANGGTCAVGGGATITFTVRIPFTLIGGQDGLGLFIDQVDPQFASALETNSWNPSGQPIDPAAPSPKPRHLRRADQLLAINGRSVEQFSPAEVVHWIHSLGSLAMEHAGSPPATVSDHTNGPPVANPVCQLTLLVVYNPVQYYQLVNSLNGQRSAHTDSIYNSGRQVGSNHTGVEAPSSKKVSLPAVTVTHSPRSPGRSGPGPRVPPRSRDSVGATDPGLAFPSPPNMNRSHSAHNSPTRRTDANGTSSGQSTVSRSPIRSPDSTLWSQSGVSPPPPPHRRHLTVAEPPQSFTRSKRSSSQPDLSALGPAAPRMMMIESSATFWRPTPQPTHAISSSHHPPEGMRHAAGGDPSYSVIRVWRAADSGRDQSSKLVVLPGRQTNALHATRLAVEEFGIPEDELDAYSLYHVTVEPGPVVKQSRLANTTDDLAGRMTLNARYYLKLNRSHEPLVADDVAKAILVESRVTFTQLVPEDLAIQLTLDDYEVFRAVQSTEYIDEVFGLIAPNETRDLADAILAECPVVGYATGHDNLDRFTELVNREAYWVPTEICQEPNLARRVDLLKRFIKLVKFCRDLRNYNTMFCLLVGLHQTPVERLKQTWEKLPNKYQKMYNDLSMVLDTSRNFFQYRSLLAQSDASAPLLPYLPLVLKDLTFIHLGNPSRTADGLVNFVKLRMLAKEIRSICRMCNVDYDLSTAQRLLRRIGTRSRGWPGSGVGGGGGSGGGAGLGGGGGALGKSVLLGSVKASNGWDLNPSISFLSQEFKRQDIGSEEERQQSHTGSGGGRNLINGGPSSRRRSGGVFLFGSNANSVSAHAKKLYESWLVALRIRTYLANLCVISDPESLSQLSARIEPGATQKSVAGRHSITNAASDQPTSPVNSSSPTSTKEPAKPSTTKAINPTTGTTTGPPVSAALATTSVSSVATTTTSSSSSSQATSTPLRPILGAQSVEDARKLFALSECHRRSQRRSRIPAFTFPHGGQNQQNPGPHVVFWTPSQAGCPKYVPSQWSVPRAQHALVLSQSGQPCAGSSPCACQNPSHVHRPPSTTSTSQAYTFVGSKSLLLDTLIPMPQRIGSTAMRCSPMHLPVVPTQRLAGPAVLHSAARCPAATNSSSSIQNQQLKTRFSSPVGDATGASTRPCPTQTSRPPHNSSPTNRQQRHPQPMPRHVSCATTSSNNGHLNYAPGQHPKPEDGYRYPTANMHQAPLRIGTQYKPQMVANRIQSGAPQPGVDRKPNQPPPYELALALRQQQQRHIANAIRMPGYADFGRGHSQGQQQQRAFLYPGGFTLVGPTSGPIGRASSVNPDPVSNPRDPQGQATPQSHLPGVSHASTVPCPASAKVQMRPVPPSYHQVVSMNRYNQQQQQQQSHRAHMANKFGPTQNSNAIQPNSNFPVDRNPTNRDGVMIGQPNGGQANSNSRPADPRRR